jgi:hypothetical protein
MRLVTVWKYCEQQWFQILTPEVLCVLIVLLSHQTDGMESVDSSNNGQHEVLRPGLLLHRLRGIISQ